MQARRGVTHVLHLIDPRSPCAGPGTLRLLADFISRDRHANVAANGADQAITHTVLVIGRGAEERLAHSCGVDPIGSIWPRGGRVLGAAPAVRRWLSAARSAGALPDLAHAWSGGCAALAAVAAPALPRVVTPTPAAIEIDSPHIIGREAVRERWLRHEGVQHDEFVIGLLGENVNRFDARQAMHVGARTGLSSRRVRLVISGSSMGRPAAHRFLAALDLDRSIIQDEAVAQPWRVLSGLDAALLLAPVADGTWHGHRSEPSLSLLPLLWAWAGGVPVIAEESAPLSGLLQHGVNGLSFPAGDLNTACDRVARLHDDRELARRLVQAGRLLMRERFALDEFCQRVHEGYDQALRRSRVVYIGLDGQAS
jgi:hypothetical protein